MQSSKLEHIIIRSDPFLTWIIDAFVGKSVSRLLAILSGEKWLVTILLTKVDWCGGYGLVNLDKEGRIMEFQEKKKRALFGQRSWSLTDKLLLASFPRTGLVFRECEVFPRGVGSSLFGKPTVRMFVDLRIPENFDRARGLLEAWPRARPYREYSSFRT